MLALGLFVFQLQTLPYSTLSRNVNYRWANNAVLVCARTAVFRTGK
ncbi:hypothetical protein HAT91_02609 [Dickeya solani]|nr:hypothetical protein HAT91_02609 [Dickeya solani]